MHRWVRLLVFQRVFIQQRFIHVRRRVFRCIRFLQRRFWGCFRLVGGRRVRLA
jgi:hypothetical protein